jgi:Flp pilus assembly protein TadD
MPRRDLKVRDYGADKEAFHLSRLMPAVTNFAMRRNLFIGLLLAGITLAIYWPVRHFDLVYFDDPLVLTDCPQVQAGLTWASLQWAMTGVVIANWHPVTNLSFLVLSQLFGTSPGPHHLANALIHAANAAVLFLLLFRLTGATWQSAAVAAIFAWHPLRVESVAWIAERKDVLCAFFFLLSLLAYARYAQERPKVEGREPGAGDGVQAPVPRRWPPDYGLALLAFVLALLSKPMAVTLPFVLLLLDVWPLRRMTNDRWQVAELKKLTMEKWPFFALAAVFCAATFWIQHDYAAMTPWDKLGLDARVANAISGYVNYPAQLFWPVNLAAIYPFPKSYDVTEMVLKAALLATVSAGCVTQLARRPWLAVGWFWYLGTALPVIGIVQVGSQSMADRYTYLPLIGPVMAIVWMAAEMFSRRRGGNVFLATVATIMLTALVCLTTRQLAFWRNTIALFAHNIAVTPENAAAHYTLGLGFEHAGDTNRAIVCYRAAKALEPGDPQTRRNLAALLLKQGHLPAAENEYDELLLLNPDDFAAHASLAGVLAARGRTDEAVLQLNDALRLNPDSVEALNNLAWALATSSRSELRDGAHAVQLAQHASELTHYQKTIYVGTLAAAYAEAGRFTDAIATAEKACELAGKTGETGLLQKNRELLELYRAHRPYHESAN